MTMRRLLASACALLLMAVVLAAGGGQAASEAPAGRGGGQRGGGRADAPVLGPGNLISGVWGADATPVDSRGWGWMTKSYVSAGYKRPFYNKAKEMLFSDKQVTSFTISSFDPEFYCEVRKHYAFVWFEMQHSTMSWDNVAKMIAGAAVPGRDRRGRSGPACPAATRTPSTTTCSSW
jgi:hypothetical protein